MLSTKKAVLAAAVVASLGAGVAQAAPVVNFNFVGSFTMYDPGGAPMGTDNGVTGTMTMDFGTGAGTASIASPNTFYGYLWTAHNITLQANPGPDMTPNTMDDFVHADMLFDWNPAGGPGNVNIVVSVDFAMAPNGFGGYTVTTLDSTHDDNLYYPGYIAGDGILGNPMPGGPFAGFNATFGGTATPVPVPAAVWLLGSGLLGLVGIGRRKKVA